MEFTIRISCKEVKAGDQKFISAISCVNNTWYKVKFRSECETVPKRKGCYDLTFDEKDVSVQKGSIYIGADGEEHEGNATLWIHKVVDLYEYTEDDYADMRKDEIYKIFGLDK